MHITLLSILLAIFILFSLYMYMSISDILSYKRKGISFKETLETIGLPIVALKVNGRKLNFVLDTGASTCVLNKNSIEGLDYKKLSNEGALITRATGNTFDGPIGLFDLEYSGNIYETKFYINDISAALDEIKKQTGATVDGLIGSDFMSDNSYIFDFKDYVAYVAK